MIRIGSAIKEVRKSKGLSGKFVAGKLGVDPSTLSKIENNHRRLDADLLPKLAEIYGVDIALFFTEKIDETPTISNTG